MRRIGIITWHNYPNVGSALQAYALHTFINNHNGNATIINYSPFGRPSLWLIRLIISKFDFILPRRISKYFHYRFIAFEKKYFKETKLIKSVNGLRKTNNHFDTFICGSDQIWAPNVFHDEYMLSFVNDDKIKIAYAASIGLPSIPIELQDTYKKLLNKLQFISVREQQGANLLKQLFKIDSTVVLDPTLLLTPKDYDKIAATTIKPTKYILCYFLGENEEHRIIVSEFSKKINLPIVSISRNKIDFRDNFITDIDTGPREFLSYVRDAEFVFTDSFHGLCFSINFNVNFYVTKRFSEDSPINQNSRIINILNIFNLEDRLITQVPSKIEYINFSNVNKNLELLRTKSHDFLKKSIEL